MRNALEIVSPAEAAERDRPDLRDQGDDFEFGESE
jgi:hypothetical protein